MRPLAFAWSLGCRRAAAKPFSSRANAAMGLTNRFDDDIDGAGVMTPMMARMRRLRADRTGRLVRDDSGEERAHVCRLRRVHASCRRTAASRLSPGSKPSSILGRPRGARAVQPPPRRDGARADADGLGAREARLTCNMRAGFCVDGSIGTSAGGRGDPARVAAGSLAGATAAAAAAAARSVAAAAR